MMNHNVRCSGCKSSEARCAWLRGACCKRCSHFGHLDAYGNGIQRVSPTFIPGVVCSTCHQPIPPSGRQSCPGDCLEQRRAHDRARSRTKTPGRGREGEARPRPGKTLIGTTAEVDEVTVARLCAGERVADYTSCERREAVVRLHHAGHGRKPIARMLQIDARQVFRDLERAGLVGNDVGAA